MLSTVAVFILSLLWVRQMVRLLLIPRNVLMPAVFIICVTGAYALSGRIFDIYVMFGFGLVGVLLQELEYPLPPLSLDSFSDPWRKTTSAGPRTHGGGSSPSLPGPFRSFCFVSSSSRSSGRPAWEKPESKIMALWSRKDETSLAVLLCLAESCSFHVNLSRYREFLLDNRCIAATVWGPDQTGRPQPTRTPGNRFPSVREG